MYVNHMAQIKLVKLWPVQDNVGYKSLYCVFLNFNV